MIPNPKSILIKSITFSSFTQQFLRNRNFRVFLFPRVSRGMPEKQSKSDINQGQMIDHCSRNPALTVGRVAEPRSLVPVPLCRKKMNENHTCARRWLHRGLLLLLLASCPAELCRRLPWLPRSAVCISVDRSVLCLLLLSLLRKTL